MPAPTDNTFADPPVGPTIDGKGVGLLAYETPVAAGPAWRVWLMVILLLGLFARIGFSIWKPVDVASFQRLPDQFEYYDCGVSLLEGNGFRIEPGIKGEFLYAYRMPAYPLFIAACGASPRVVTTVQALLDVSSAVAMYLVARRLTSPPAGLVAAAAVAFNPYLIYFASLLLSETLFTAFVAWGVYALVQPERRWKVAGVGLLLFSVYVRPSAIGLGVVAAAAASVSNLGKGCQPRKAIQAVALASLALVLLLWPWAERNKAILGTRIWTTTNSGYTAYDSFNPHADGSSNQAWFRSLMRPDRSSATTRPLAEFNELSRLGEVGRSANLSRFAWEYARDHPGRVAQLAAMKLGRFWSPVPLSNDFASPLYVVAGALYVVPLFALSAMGIWRGGLARHTTLILLVPVLYFSAVHCVFVGSLRYRVPGDVPLAVLAAAGAMSFSRPTARPA